MAIVTATTIPTTSSHDNSGGPGGSRRDLVLQFNNLLTSYAALALPFTSDGVLNGTTFSNGTTVTLATAACTITIAGVPVKVAATTAQAFGSLGTIPASKWGVIAVDAVAAGTISFVATDLATGFATEALAIADAIANLGKTANKARLGYITILATSSTWIAGTDGMTGQSGGNPATTTNFYPIASPFQLTAQSANAISFGSIGFTAKQIGNLSGTVLSA